MTFRTSIRTSTEETSNGTYFIAQKNKIFSTQNAHLVSVTKVDSKYIETCSSWHLIRVVFSAEIFGHLEITFRSIWLYFREKSNKNLHNTLFYWRIELIWFKCHWTNWIEFLLFARKTVNFSESNIVYGNKKFTEKKKQKWIWLIFRKCESNQEVKNQ